MQKQKGSILFVTNAVVSQFHSLHGMLLKRDEIYKK